MADAWIARASDFAIRPPTQFSAVSLPSAPAGPLLSPTLLRTTIYNNLAPRSSDLTRLNFLNGGLWGTAFGRDEACELRCRERKAQARP